MNAILLFTIFIATYSINTVQPVRQSDSLEQELNNERNSMDPTDTRLDVLSRHLYVRAKRQISHRHRSRGHFRRSGAVSPQIGRRPFNQSSNRISPPSTNRFAARGRISHTNTRHNTVHDNTNNQPIGVVSFSQRRSFNSPPSELRQWKGHDAVHRTSMAPVTFAPPRTAPQAVPLLHQSINRAGPPRPTTTRQPRWKTNRLTELRSRHRVLSRARLHHSSNILRSRARSLHAHHASLFDSEKNIEHAVLRALVASDLIHTFAPRTHSSPSSTTPLPTTTTATTTTSSPVPTRRAFTRLSHRRLTHHRTRPSTTHPTPPTPTTQKHRSVTKVQTSPAPTTTAATTATTTTAVPHTTRTHRRKQTTVHTPSTSTPSFVRETKTTKVVSTTQVERTTLEPLRTTREPATAIRTPPRFASTASEATTTTTTTQKITTQPTVTTTVPPETTTTVSQNISLEEEIHNHVSTDGPSPPPTARKMTSSSTASPTPPPVENTTGAAPPGASPPNDLVVKKLNNADNFMEVARDLRIFRKKVLHRRRRRMADYARQQNTRNL